MARPDEQIEADIKTSRAGLLSPSCFREPTTRLRLWLSELGVGIRTTLIARLLPRPHHFGMRKDANLWSHGYWKLQLDSRCEATSKFAFAATLTGLPGTVPPGIMQRKPTMDQALRSPYIASPLALHR